MDDYYELIDLKSGNLVGDYDCFDEVSAILRSGAYRYGRSAIENLSLMRIRGDEQSLVAMREDLLELVGLSTHQRADTAGRTAPLTRTSRTETRSSLSYDIEGRAFLRIDQRWQFRTEGYRAFGSQSVLSGAVALEEQQRVATC